MVYFVNIHTSLQSLKCLICLVSLLGATPPRIDATFGPLLTPRVTSEGDTLTIAAAFASSDTIFIYANADGSILVYDTTGVLLKKVLCEDFGRGPYLGDDFIVQGRTAIFLNTIDQYLEYFSLDNGMHLRSIPYPADHFSKESLLADRLIDRIFSADSRIVLGNGKRQFYFDPTLRIAATDASAVFAGYGKRIICWNGKTAAEETSSGTGVETAAMIYKKVESAPSIRGKQYLFVNKTLYALSISNTGFTVSEVLP